MELNPTNTSYSIVWRSTNDRLLLQLQRLLPIPTYELPPVQRSHWNGSDPLGALRARNFEAAGLSGYIPMRRHFAIRLEALEMWINFDLLDLVR